MRLTALTAALALATTLVACGESEVGAGGDGGGLAGSGGTGGRGFAPGDMPALDELTPGQWNRIYPGGDTLCALGAPYSFYVYPGAADRVAVDFMGGGACWQAEGLGTCREGGPYTPTVDVNVPIDDPPAGYGGLLDRENEQNPLDGWTHVVVAYCTGDIHWGNNDFTYGEGDKAYVVHHRGAVNAGAALGWVYENVPSPSKVLVTGCSAGAYGSILWSAHVQQHYPDVDVVQFADSGAGVITPEFRTMNFPQWNTDGAFPSFIPALDPSKVDVTALELTDAYVAIGQHFPDMRLSQFNYLNDETQIGFYLLMGGPVLQWSSTMLGHMADIRDRTSSFRSYVADDTLHCVTPWQRFYTEGVPGEVGVRDWLAQLIDGQDPGDVACPDCTLDR